MPWCRETAKFSRSSRHSQKGTVPPCWRFGSHWLFVQLSPRFGISSWWMIYLGVLLPDPLAPPRWLAWPKREAGGRGRQRPLAPRGWELQAGATLFFFFLGIETLSNYCEERTACPLLHIPCPLPVIWIVFGRICLVRVGTGGTYFSHLQILGNRRKREQNVH